MATCHLMSKCCILTWISVLMLSSLSNAGEESTAEPTDEQGLLNSYHATSSSLFYGVSSSLYSFLIQPISPMISMSKTIVRSSSYLGSTTGIVRKSTVASSRFLSSSSTYSTKHVLPITSTANSFSPGVSQAKESSVTKIMPSSYIPTSTKKSTNLKITYIASGSNVYLTSSPQYSNTEILPSALHDSSFAVSSLNVVLPTLSSIRNTSTSGYLSIPNTSQSKSTSSLNTVMISLSVIDDSIFTIEATSNTVTTNIPLSSIVPSTLVIVKNVTASKNMTTRTATYDIVSSITSLMTGASSSNATSTSPSGIVPSSTTKNTIATPSTILISSKENLSSPSPGLPSSDQATLPVSPSPSMLVQTSPLLPSETLSTHTPYLTSASVSARSVPVSLISMDTSKAMTSSVSSMFSMAKTIIPTSSFIHMSSPVIPTTPSIKVPSEVLNLTGKAIDSTSVYLSWKKPLHPNGPLIYVVEQNGKQVYQGPKMNITISGLSVYTEYCFIVYANNTKSGLRSNGKAINVTTLQSEPTAPPQDVKASTLTSVSILVQWKPPPTKYIHGVIKHYIVEYFRAKDRNYVKNSTTTKTSVILKGLLPFTEYYIRVKAVNDIGPGPASEDITNTTFEDAPSQPTNFTVWSVNSTSLSTMWSPPNMLNGVSVKYKLYYRLSTLSSNKDGLAYDGPNTEFVLTGLQKFSNYTLTLFAYNVKLGDHSREVVLSAFTYPAVATEPVDLNAWNTSSNSIFVSWLPPEHINGVLTYYEVFYKCNCSASTTGNVNTSLTNATLSPLTVYTLYIIYVYAVTSQGSGRRATVIVSTDEGIPSQVQSFRLYKQTETTVLLKWTPPQLPNGHIGYKLMYGLAGSNSSNTNLLSKTFISITKLMPYTMYRFTLSAYNLKSGLSGLSQTVHVRTLPGKPTSPRNVRLVYSTSETLNITWNPPATLNGEFYYTVRVNEGKDVYFRDPVRVIQSWILLSGLKPNQLYTIYVSCTTNGGSGPYSEKKTFSTLPSVPPTVSPIKPPNKDTITENQIVIELEKASDSNGKISFYQVIVLELERLSDGTAKMPDRKPDDYTSNQLSTYFEAMQKKPRLVPYIAAQFPADMFSKYQLFKVGDGRNFSISARKRRSVTSQYYNGPLEPSTFYTMFQRAAVNKDIYRSTGWTQPVSTSESPPERKNPEIKSSTNVGLVAGLCVVLLLLIVLAIVLISRIYRKRRFPFGIMLDDESDYSKRSFKLKKMHGSKRRRTSSRGLMGSTDSLDNLDDINRRRQPIPIESFANHVRLMHIDGDIGFSEEYELVQPDDKDFTWQHSLNPVNKHKNRYANIVAYDHSRVLLTQIEGVQGSDYINANHIDGYNRSGAYIATQGPLPETFDDFWRMIWEQGTATIVMLTQLEERGRRKCDQYWPDRGTHTYGVIRVTASESSHMSYYNLRVFIISHKNEEEEPRQVKQYHFTSWPDHGVPTHPVPLLSLVRTVANANPASAGPVVVHCSAGVGRTGTYISLDSVLQRIEKENTIDVYEFVQNMRTKRNLMVQTESQYVFIHDALVEAVSCGITECEAKKFSSRLRELREIDPVSGRTYMEKEFLRLIKDERHHSTFKAANMGVNSSKNRYLNILPYEQTRVPLKMRPGEVGSDYINASYIDGYCRRKVYIATQAPLPCTFEDYWRMIWEQGSCVIVMITKEEEAGKVKCHRYWPSDGTRIFGNILVELIEEVSYTDYTMRQFNMTHTEEKGSRVVRQYHYTDWPDHGLPESGVGIIDLIGQVEKWQQQSNNSIITVHCSGGVGRTGVYCAISILIERVKSEGVIDVFQTVQSLRLQRPAMVQILEQYEFCYSTLQEYLDSFDLYANFN